MNLFTSPLSILAVFSQVVSQGGSGYIFVIAKRSDKFSALYCLILPSPETGILRGLKYEPRILNQTAKQMHCK